MAKFQFRLQSVMVLRERERDEAADSYRQAQLAITKLEEEIDSIMQEHAAQSPFQSSSSVGIVQPQRLLESQRYQMHLMQQVQQLRSQIKLIEQEKERRRLVLVKCEQALKSLEKFKEKQHEEWETQELANQQIALDQWAGFRYWKENNHREEIDS